MPERLRWRRHPLGLPRADARHRSRDWGFLRSRVLTGCICQPPTMLGFCRLRSRVGGSLLCFSQCMETACDISCHIGQKSLQHWTTQISRLHRNLWQGRLISRSTHVSTCSQGFRPAASRRSHRPIRADNEPRFRFRSPGIAFRLRFAIPPSKQATMLRPIYPESRQSFRHTHCHSSRNDEGDTPDGRRCGHWDEPRKSLFI
ncbi:hypothetical protein QBC34DRAFT_86490 [Podospora aff. communis PSN243]|uniref:Uncharacterized protein n=1 Tax=Podospora aff. communis PSN243 TaxID=3040156 RepID=A0AAV9GM15_9PEZI|nr:hypothetical protein QBC34DRAFT_86490 [Podospora aff. communis PSN243]